MAKGRHAAEPVRRSFPLPLSLPRRLPGRLPRPLPRPLVTAAAAGTAVAVGGPALTFSLGIADWPFDRSAVQPVVAAPGASPSGSTEAADLARMQEAREMARADRSRSLLPGPRTPSPTPTTQDPTPEPPAAPSPPPAPEPPPVPAVVGQLWATTDVNVRAEPSADSERVGSLAAVTQVDVTGATDDGWTQVVIDGRASWVNSSYLSESMPEPEPAGVSDAACAINPEIEDNLTANARAVYRAVCAEYGDTVSAFGGYRPGDDGDHGTGRAVDAMVTGEPGWDIARYVQENAAALGVTYVIYEQRIWHAGNPLSAWEWMEDRGSATANHYDHVHVSVS